MRSYYFVILSIYNIASCTAENTSTLTRIVKGKDAIDNQFPYQISLQKLAGGFNHHCGGSIIGPSKILTAAHCVSTKNGRPHSTLFYRILAGTRYRSNSNKQGSINRVHKIIVHPRYTRKLVHFDIAILTVRHKYDFQLPQFGAIKLRTADVPAGTECHVTGWGVTLTEHLPPILQYAVVQIVPHKKCREMFASHSIQITGNMICALGKDLEDSAAGDSGGPLVCMDELVGVVSFGLDSLVNQFPGVYTDVASVREWIVQNGAGHMFITYARVFIFGVIGILISN